MTNMEHGQGRREFLAGTGLATLAMTCGGCASWFKLSGGRRLFRMAPIHHHFEMLGWSENKIVAVFSAFSLLASGLAYLILF